jgi:hypothetical protein
MWKSVVFGLTKGVAELMQSSTMHQLQVCAVCTCVLCSPPLCRTGLAAFHVQHMCLHVHIAHIASVLGWPPITSMQSVYTTDGGRDFPHLRVSAGAIPVGNAIAVWRMCLRVTFWVRCWYT